MLIAFFVSAFATLLILQSSRVHARHSADRDFSKPQKFHGLAVPRIGGIAIVLGVCACALVRATTQQAEGSGFLLLLACAMPAFLVGVVQDLTDALSPGQRLLATALSAALAFFAIDAALTHTGIPGLDWLVGFTLGSFALSLLAVAGMAHAVNIIDGFNGLASMCAVLMLLALACVAYRCSDMLIVTLALAGVGAVLGFFAWNFPGGLIFLGDGGAYFLGFFVAELALLLLQRNPGEVSPLCPLLVCAYPVFETLFSIYRRHLRALPASMADGLHLHSLIYRRVMRRAAPRHDVQTLARRNSMTSPCLWLLCLLSVVPAVLFSQDSAVLAGFLLLFAAGYVTLYWRIVRFRSPRWLRWPQRGATFIAGQQRI